MANLTQPPTPRGEEAETVLRTGPPSRLARNLVIGTLIAFVIASNLGNAFLSVLVDERPLLFIALNAQNRNLALASGLLDPWSFYVVGFLRLLAPDPLFFLLGRWYGDSAISWMERKAPAYGQLLRQLERWFDKARIPIVAFAPNNPICLFAGASGMSWSSFLAANVVGTVGRLFLIRTFSNWFEGPLGSLREFIADYRWPLLAVSIALVVLSSVADRRGGRDGITDLATMDEDIAAHTASPETD
ncbi:MAG: VTT domain-containing protein [Acidimicrobiales bacterium]|nr:VTT domain-containing protein [Acidimicrobiales bacterium]